MAQTKEERKKASVITPVFRLSYPWYVKPQPPKPPNTVAKFGNMCIFTPAEFDEADKIRWKELARIANEASMKMFQLPLSQLPPNHKRPFHRGDEKPELGLTKEQFFINVTSNVRPGLLKRDGKTKVVTDAEIAEIFYPGCYVRASLNAFPFNKNGGKGVAFGLNNVMFVKKGDRLDNRVSAEEEFAELGEDEPTTVNDLDDFLGLGTSDNIPF